MHTEAAPSSSGLTNGLCHICHEFVHVRKWCTQPLTDAFTQDINNQHLVQGQLPFLFLVFQLWNETTRQIKMH